MCGGHLQGEGICSGKTCTDLDKHLQISPFSAVISLKKSFLRDNFGAIRLTPASSKYSAATPEITAALAAKNLQLEKDIENLRNDFQFTIADCESDYQKIKVLEDQLNHAGNLIRIKTEAENLETLNFCDKDLVEQSAAAREQKLSSENLEMKDEKSAVVKPLSDAEAKERRKTKETGVTRSERS